MASPLSISKLEAACRPVLFEQDHHQDVPYWGKGSSFLIATSNNYYWVTASHVFENTGGCAKALRIFPSDNSRISLPFNEKYTVHKGLTDDEDYKDICMLRIDLNDFDSSGDAPLIAQDIEQGVIQADQLKQDDELWIIGYPSDSNSIDYDNFKIENTRCVLKAKYKEPSISAHCHELIINSSITLNNYDGLSGAPVFYMKQMSRNGQIADYPLLVGMLLRGTASSTIAHFVCSSVIVNIINLLEANA